ncbi:hypothetical protein GF352_03855 [archaeon]|nr:hypothetical protein [archaeon]
MALLLINCALGLTCTADNTGKPGTCINSTFNMFGADFYKACHFNPYYSSGSLWVGYEVCYATIRTGSLTTDTGTPIADYWTTNQNQLTLCQTHNAAGCDVSPGNGFNINDGASDRGYCDASDGNCVKCDSNNVETNSWSGGPWITNPGDGYCESGCGAHAWCDEKTTNAYAGESYCVSAREAYCNSSCGVVAGTCEQACGAQSETDEKDTGEVCITDYCQDHRLYDYNGDGLINPTLVQSDCTCDVTIDSSLCDAINCNADLECDNESPGYHVNNIGCDTVCSWVDCGLYDWDTTSCYNSCNHNGHCYEPGVCDLVGAGVNTCVVDALSPSVTITFPTGTPLINYSFNLDYTVSDEVDLFLNCYYSVDNNTPISLGEDGQGPHSESIVVSEDWHSIIIECIDDSNNSDYSLNESFLYDVSRPDYENHGWVNASGELKEGLVTVANTLNLHAFWTDNNELNTSVLWTNKTGIWLKEGVIDHHGSSSGWSNYSFNCLDYANTTIAWQIVTNDSAGNHNETIQSSFTVYNYTTDISVNLNEDPVNGYLEWEADAQSTTAEPPFDSQRTTQLGDFNVTHDGMGLPINISFWLNESLSTNFAVKLNDENNYASAIELTTTPQEACGDIHPGSACQVWVWLDWTGDEPTSTLINNVIEMESYAAI